MTRWFTRNSTPAGELSSVINEWSQRPERTISPISGAAIWLTPLECEHGVWVRSYSIAEAKALLRTIPDTDLECVRYG